MFSGSKNHKGILGAFLPFGRSGITKSLISNDFQFILVPFGKSWFCVATNHSTDSDYYCLKKCLISL